MAIPGDFMSASVAAWAVIFFGGRWGSLQENGSEMGVQEERVTHKC